MQDPKGYQIPERYGLQIELGLNCVRDPSLRLELAPVAKTIASRAWSEFLYKTDAGNNSQAHEFSLFQVAMAIADAEQLGLSGRKVITAFVFHHDRHPIRRIMEKEIRDLEERAEEIAGSDPAGAARLRAQAAELKRRRKEQRVEHMVVGSQEAQVSLPQLRNPASPTEPLLSESEIEHAVDIIRQHDGWKAGRPYPLIKDLTACICFESDVVWPLLPQGCLADLERAAAGGVLTDTLDPGHWKQKVQESLETMKRGKPVWEGLGEPFIGNSIFRTKEGYRLYIRWREFWGC
jgi:hypothetical protein